ncbi:MAG TPA: ATP-binding cassette domain-containing protein [Caldithrix abyssi]|uniref:ATP-binding cassette domain-containing protein n=1 Tax=Caldithrix abyssi TaxID=187145 RepID=A0A7V5PMQ0_CALAY|nr:ATP-binding cassette domain-containing protein [Caldithrix abyssi]
MAKNILEVRSISKTFKETVVVEDLSFSVKGGEVFGLLGPNGAGKTTTMRMIMNILVPDQGEILFNEQPRAKIKNDRFGYLPEERGLYPRATVLDMLIYFGTLNDLSPRKAEVEAIRYLDRLGLIEFTDARLNELSKGMQQKIQFIAAFLHDPDVLILDEPFTGLDPINQIVLREILDEYKKKNKILIISTHQMDQAEKLCDHICLINQARIIEDGLLRNIKKKFREEAYYVESEQPLEFIKDIQSISIIEQDNRSCKFTIVDRKTTVSQILSAIEKKAAIKRFEVVEPNLHDIFIKLIQQHTKVEE